MIKGFNLKKYNPEAYSYKGRSFYFDNDRGFLVEKDGKEEVRQRLIEYLNKELFVPYNAIRTDVAMYNFEKKAKGRADILITALSDDGYDVPITVIRCGDKSRDIKGRLKTEALKQLAQTLSVCAGVSNGIDFDFYVNEENEPVLKSEALSYPALCDMLGVEGYEYEPEPSERQAYSYYCSAEGLNDGITYGIIGEDTDKSLAPFILNLNGCLMYEAEKLLSLKGNGFELEKDMGLKYIKADNGLNGNYRVFLLKTKEGIRGVCAAVLSSETGRACTYLSCAVDDNNGVKQSYRVKELVVLDESLSINEKAKSASLCGSSFKTDKILSINDAEVKKLLSCVIEKALKA